MTKISERIYNLMDEKGISKKEMANKLGVHANNLNRMIEGDIKFSTITEIALALKVPYYELTSWGNDSVGLMLPNLYDGPPEGIPLLPIEAFAGLGDNEVSGAVSYERFQVDFFKDLKVDCMVKINGSSMYPKFRPGDTVACRIVEEILYIQWNKVYVIDTLTQGVILKRLKQSPKDGYVICRSDNPDYTEFEVPMTDIRRLALVVGLVRVE